MAMFEVPCWDERDAKQDKLSKRLFDDSRADESPKMSLKLKTKACRKAKTKSKLKRHLEIEGDMMKAQSDGPKFLKSKMKKKDSDVIRKPEMSEEKHEFLSAKNPSEFNLDNERDIIEKKCKKNKTKKEKRDVNLERKKDSTSESMDISDKYKSKTKLDSMNVSSITTPSAVHSKFNDKLRKKLDGAQFRWINEQLYTINSNNAQEMFTKEPMLFDVYHRGFQSQVTSWPQNPVDMMIQQLKKCSEDIVVADLGCGDAKIAQNVKQKVYSFDLIAKNDFVIPADIARVPLKSASVNVAIFCLSLMGLNVSEFLQEANRILKPRGILKIAEVKSRFEDLQDFVKKICDMGFILSKKDESNKMFVLMDFVKTKEAKRELLIADIHLKPCIYKKR